MSCRLVPFIGDITVLDITLYNVTKAGSQGDLQLKAKTKSKTKKGK